VRVQEVGEGPPVLFLHGGPNAGSTWVPLLEHLDGCGACWSTGPGRGCPRPTRSPRRTCPASAPGSSPRLLDGLGITRAHVVASSFGGHLALRSAAADPDRFLRMVQMAAPALIPGDTIPPFMRLLARGTVRRLLNALPPNERANRAIFRQIGHGKPASTPDRIPQSMLRLVPRPAAVHRHDAQRRRDDRQRHPQVDEIRLTDELLAQVRVPTLFWWGADDTFGGEDVARHLVEVMPDAELTMVPDAGHLPWLDDPRAAAAATTAFLHAEVTNR
jgi:2-hydroxy-6-oxonona-2,4-dienedioate hydrolase